MKFPRPIFLAAFGCAFLRFAAAEQTITIDAGRSSIDLVVGRDGRLYQSRFADVQASGEENPAPAEEAYLPAGDRSLLTPAIRVTHADGNPSTALEFVEARTKSVSDGVTETRVDLRDPVYPLRVTLVYRAYPREQIVETWAEIIHEEPGSVLIEEAASSAPYFGRERYVLTHFRGDWADEMHEENERLGYGQKILSSRGIARAHKFQAPFFLLSRGEGSTETTGAVFGGTLAHSGSFSFDFEVDPAGGLRAVCGLNSEGAAYRLDPGQRFTTPPMIWGFSDAGRGDLARRLARWGRAHGMRDGSKPRDILLNNWEATEFAFDESKLTALFDEAKALGFELFLLDDGWFGNRFPRNDDTQGLGDWEVNRQKLPRGLGYLAEQAAARGVRFGLWLEPEMVNPKSELFEKHPDWAIAQPRREPSLERNQLTLDLANPAVKEWMFNFVDGVLTANPQISYVKWDCNRMVTQPGSAFLPADRQSNQSVDYQRALYEVMDRIVERHPKVELMVCAGGGGRVDYGSLRRAHEFWPSDNTDPLSRVRIQWGLGQFFPANAISAHVTAWNKRPLKFAFDVAMSARLGMDMDPTRFSEADRKFAKAAIEAYKGIRETVQLGDLYRLEPPTGARASQMSVSPDQAHAALFVWQVADGSASPVRLAGLDPAKTYRLREINLAPGQATILAGAPEKISGRELMENGIPIPFTKAFESAVVRLDREP